MRGGKPYVVAGLLAAAFLFAANSVDSSSSGMDRSKGFTEQGCICHGPNEADDGVPNPNVHALFRLNPSIATYSPGVSYNLTVGAAESDVPMAEGEFANKGGFNLLASLGTLEAAPGFEDFVEVHGVGQGFEATHTSEGDRNGRVFELVWTAPPGDQGPVLFTLFVNTVNGDDKATADDHWTGARFIVPGPSGEVSFGAEEDPVKVGVRWYAHWVGVASFAAVAVTLVIYYFVLKYGESIHTTDHRDRKEK